eukprot:EG_transcript_45563
MDPAQPITLPKNLKGHVKYLLATDLYDGQLYSVGIRYVLPTLGAQRSLTLIQRQRYRPYKKSINGTFCPTMGRDPSCQLGINCNYIHITAEGFTTRRIWHRHTNNPKPSDAEDTAESSNADEQPDSDDPPEVPPPP